MIRIMVGDCTERLKEIPDESVDSAVCDPPYHLTSIVKRFGAANAAPAKVGATGAYARASRGFMGQQWDGGDVAFRPETWAEVLRVLKPGGHLVAFSGTRTYHRLAVAIEDAGFEIRDQLAWAYGSGFPKSHNQPGGWGTALKPAWEPICLARKPLMGTVAANVLAHGTGALNIDGCRISSEDETIERGELDAAYTPAADGYTRANRSMMTHKPAERAGPANHLGRFPANIVHDGSPEVLAGFPETESGSRKAGDYGYLGGDIYSRRPAGPMPALPGDSGSAARFFYTAKTDAAERHAGCHDLEKGNNHPTVKPVDLMRWLCRLVTPKGGTVLDPFMGSGSTMIAADAEQMNGIGCELSPEYAAIAERRIRQSAGMFAQVEIL